jgi:hypothetical protein
MLGHKFVGVIRQSNNSCVDFSDKDGQRCDWFCLEHVLKTPTLFVPIVICRDAGCKRFDITPIDIPPTPKKGSVVQKVKAFFRHWFAV